MPKHAKPAAHTLRIIGGRWRSRRIPIESAPGLRPTSDRIRETLFNWLAPRIEGARCLDLFAGTGALGLEAMSRGAAHVTFIDNQTASTDTLRGALTTLDSSNADVIQGDALPCVSRLQNSYDIIFIDPPFDADLHAGALSAVKPLTQPNARIYLEYPAEHAGAIESNLPPGWQLLRSKRAGRVGYCLASTPQGES